MLEELQAQLYSILDSIDALVYVIELDTHDILYMNEKSRGIFGNVTGQKCYSHIHSNPDGPCSYCTNHLLINNHIPTGVYRWEYRNIQNGRWFDCRDRAINWTDGRLVKLEIATDITQFKEVEERLLKERWRLDNIIEGTHAGTWEWNVQTGEVIINEQLISMLGYSRDELSPIDISKREMLIHPADLSYSKTCLKKHYSGKFPNYDCEIRLKHKKGNWIWMYERGRVFTWTDDGLPLLMFGTLTNITRRKHYEEALRKSEAYYRTVFENTGTATVILEENDIIRLANNEFADLSGFSKSDIEGKKTWLEFVVKEDIEKMLNQKRIRMEDESKALPHYEFRFVTRTGEIRNIYLTIGIIPGTQIRITSLLDITGIKRPKIIT